MSVILFVLGILLTGVGIVLVGFSVPINESAIGQTLIIAGAVAIVGGLVLVGLGSAVSQLAQIAAGLKARPASRTGRVAAAVQRAEEIFPDPHVVETRAPEPRVAQVRTQELRLPEPSMADPLPVESIGAAHPAAVTTTALDRLRATMARPAPHVPTPSAAEVEEDMPLSPNGSQHPTAPMLDPPMEATPVAVQTVQRAPEPVARAAPPADNASKEPRLDFLFRSRPTRPVASESFDSMWPKRSARAPEPAKAEKADRQERIDETATMTMEMSAPVEERRSVPMMEERRAAARAPALPERAPLPQPDEGRPAVAILKSGVVDGMAYTLYADGSIEAQLPQGTVRFGSIAELRAHIENNS